MTKQEFLDNNSRMGGLSHREVAPAGRPAGHPSQHTITPAGNARLQTQRNVSTAPFHGAPRGQANAQRFQARRFNLGNKPNPAIASTRFRANNQIQGSQNWQGQRYQAFRTYRSQWHDRGWWGGRYNRIGLFGGGYYYWNNGFRYPAWGYDPGYSYYPYDVIDLRLQQSAARSGGGQRANGSLRKSRDIIRAKWMVCWGQFHARGHRGLPARPWFIHNPGCGFVNARLVVDDVTGVGLRKAAAEFPAVRFVSTEMSILEDVVENDYLGAMEQWRIDFLHHSTAPLLQRNSE